MDEASNAGQAAVRKELPVATQANTGQLDRTSQTEPAFPVWAPSAILAPPCQLTPPSSQTVGSSNWLRDLPAWLLSLIMHLLILMLLALLVMEQEAEEPTITLSMAVSKYRQEGLSIRDLRQYKIEGMDDELQTTNFLTTLTYEISKLTPPFRIVLDSLNFFLEYDVSH